MTIVYHRLGEIVIVCLASSGDAQEARASARPAAAAAAVATAMRRFYKISGEGCEGLISSPLGCDVVSVNIRMVFHVYFGGA